MSTKKPREALMIERVNEMAQTFREGLRAMFEANPWGTRELTDAQFVAWFEMMQVGKYEPVTDQAGQPIIDPMTGQPQMQLVSGGPNWIPALQFVEEGRKEIERYQRAKMKMSMLGGMA